MITLAAHNPSPVASTWASALRDLEKAERAASQAHRAVILSAPGEMLIHLESWLAAERELERCLVRESAARLRAQGRAWLWEAR